MHFFINIFKKSARQFRTVTFNRLVFGGNIDGFFVKVMKVKTFFA